MTRFAAAFVLAIAVLLGSLAVGITGQAHAQPAGPSSVADLSEKLLGAVVNISTAQLVKRRSPSSPLPRVPEGSPFQEFFNDLFPQERDEDQSGRSARSLGSGFVISEDGLIVTNNHVIANADEITVNFADGSKLKAELVGTDPKTDLAVLRVKSDEKLQHVELGNSDKARIGDWVLAIGNPFGLGSSVSIGIVSAFGRDINLGSYDNFIQTDAAINRGNSGGPLFDMNGKVIGINTAIYSPSGGSIGIGFSVPANMAKPVIDQLIEFGETRRGWLGVQIQLVTDDIAESLGLDKARGALVGDVFKTGPAEEAGIQAGDVVLEFDGQTVETVRDLSKIVAATKVDKKVEVLLWRQGKEVKVEVTVGRLEEGEKKMKAALSGAKADDDKDAEAQGPVLGMSLEAITDEIRKAENIDAGVKGVFIAEVAPGSRAEDKGVVPGMIIVEINQQAVATPEEAVKRVEELKGMDRKNALLMVSTTKGDIRFVVLRIEG